jgi:glutamate formiminotransferase/formiminotetrahydrofolate cyclodeaminase
MTGFKVQHYGRIDTFVPVKIERMNQKPIIECVPNFSEGRNPEIIQQIARTIEGVRGVKLLNVDPGASTNRTVITFAGAPEDVIEAAFQAIRIASQLIDMRQHKGEHPRMGATDVCPLIPISGINLEETAVYAKKLGERVGKELKIPVYLYEAAASAPHRSNLAEIRSGEYEGFAEKMKQEAWKPDYGPSEFNVVAGATVIGARDFLIAYNVNLNSKSVRLANEVAYDIRENGRPKRDPETQKLIKNESGEIERIPGSCPGVKAIGWYIEEYGYAQISMNLTDLHKTPLHIAFEECRRSAEQYGLIVTGSELVGLVPKKALIDCGKYFLNKQKRSLGVTEEELIQIAIQSLGLNSVSVFEPNQRIIENMLEEKKSPLANLSLKKFAEETASDSPAPGGGSVSAYAATMGASLATMVANLTAHKKGYEDKLSYFSEIASKGMQISKELLELVDEDTAAFNMIMEAFRLPKVTAEDKKARKKAIKKATIVAIEVPLKTIKLASLALPLAKAMVENGNPNSISDAGVGALCLEAAIKGAALNVKINASGLEDQDLKKKYFEEADEYVKAAEEETKSVLAMVNDFISRS